MNLFQSSQTVKDDLKRIIIVGNAVMHNIFCGIDVEPMGFHPFEPISNNLEIMDASAISLARDNNIPIIVFSINNKKAISSVVKGKGISTIISA